MVTEMLKAECKASGTRLTEEESTLLALGIHADTGATLHATQSIPHPPKRPQMPWNPLVLMPVILKNMLRTTLKY